jgi:hypothetical protein
MYVSPSSSVMISPGELDAATPTIEVIDRRRTSLRIEVRSVAPMWSELRYALYSYVQ